MNHCTKEELIAFERRIADRWEAGELRCLLHLCGGNEDDLIEIFDERIAPGDWIFSTHRSHYHYLLAGGLAADLERMIMEGKSMFVFGRPTPTGLQCHFITSSVLAGTCAIAAGVAMELAAQGSVNKVWCFLGDGAEEQGHFYEAAMMVHNQALPCTFIVEDNDRSVDTSKEQRRGPVEGSKDRFLLCDHLGCVERYFYKPTYPHAGSGCNHQIVFKQ